MKKKVFQLLVDNTPGVLSRISGLFTRRGYNIESITAGQTADPKYTRITIVASGEDDVLIQIRKQVEKLVDVRDVKELKPENSIYSELALIKVRADITNRQNIISLSEVFKADIKDVGPESLIVEMTGSSEKIDAFLTLLEGHEVLELARTGIAGLGRGIENVTYLD
ncbi:MAG: acetolactate synthase small subunit [Lachnospiraceae bacterium]|nr:acetolactate synthase small subunit [Lachnospiraceae bacterium]SDA39363.1 acetolactate synthase, small subunit [Lachnospiraceae bacterium G11]